MNDFLDMQAKTLDLLLKAQHFDSNLRKWYQKKRLPKAIHLVKEYKEDVAKLERLDQLKAEADEARLRSMSRHPSFRNRTVGN